jgi:xanthine dehydrogenase accessory factor
VKKWLETRQVLDALAGLRAAGTECALATVIRVRGSAYRHEGAKMLVSADGRTIGNVSGGCLEADVREVALSVIASGRAERREYCGSADEIEAWDLGVGCEGVVDVFIEPAPPAIPEVRALLHGDLPFALCTDLATRSRLLVTETSAQPAGGGAAGWSRGVGDGDAFESGGADRLVARARDMLSTGESAVVEVDDHAFFIDAFTPPPTLLIVSAGEDARHLASVGAQVGFRVVVVDRRPGLLDPSRFPPDVRLVEAHPDQLSMRVVVSERCYAVLMMHNYADDREYGRALLRTSTPYVGMLGPRQRTERIIRELASTESIDESRIFGPVGLDIGTDGAEQVAVSVVSEILAVRSGRTPASLRERRTPIHAEVNG